MLILSNRKNMRDMISSNTCLAFALSWSTLPQPLLHLSHGPSYAFTSTAQSSNNLMQRALYPYYHMKMMWWVHPQPTPTSLPSQVWTPWMVPYTHAGSSCLVNPSSDTLTMQLSQSSWMDHSHVWTQQQLQQWDLCHPCYHPLSPYHSWQTCSQSGRSCPLSFLMV